MTDPDSYAIPAPGVSISSGDLHIQAADVPLGDPFNGDCIELQVTKPVDLGQLTTEIQRRTKTVPQLAMRQNLDGSPASAEQPYILWIHPGTLNQQACQQVLDRHVPIQQSGVLPATETVQEPTATTVAPKFDDSQQALVGRLEAGEQLNAAESSDLLRAILGITS